MKADSAVIEKIRKMLALAGDKAASKGEIENAMAKAKEIAMRHAIDIASIIPKNGNKATVHDIQKDSTLKTRSVREQPYHRYVYNVIMEVFEIDLVRSGHKDCYGDWVTTAIHLIGDPTDIEIVKVIFPWLESIFPRTLSRLVKKHELTARAADANGFFLGMAQGIVEANKREEEKLSEEDKQTYALVVVGKQEAIQKAKEELFPKLNKPKSNRRAHNGFAIALGQEEGRKVNLNQVK